MVERRASVYTADSTGDEKITRNRLYDLQRYVTAHMNTDMDKGITLVATYNRDFQNLVNNASKNDNIYKKVQQICMPRFSYWSQVYVQCVNDELAKFPEGIVQQNVVTLPPALYFHNFSSPLWSPDFAGWSVLTCVVILIMIIARFTSVVILRILLRQHYKSI